MTRPRRLLAAVLATAVGGGVLAAVPAAAHNPRNTPAGAPRMDLEVMVTPELEGRITPGGTDPVVSVDGFGNRFILARKEDAQTAVGVDQRARTGTRVAAWAWTSDDDGLTWRNLDLLTRGAEQLLPQGRGRDVASSGPVTAVAEDRGPVVVVHRLVAAGKGRLGEAVTALVPTGLPGGAGADVSVAVPGKDVVVAAAAPSGPTLVRQVTDGDVVVPGGVSLPGRCDVAADPRAASPAVWAACLDGDRLVLQASRDGGASFTEAAAARATGTGRPQVDVAPDGTPYALDGSRLLRLRSGRLSAQDLSLPRGDQRGTAFAVSNRGRIAATTFSRTSPAAPWTVLVALFDVGKRPVWYDFADHDPAAPAGASEPPARSTSVDTDPRGRLQLAWSATFLHGEALDRPLLRNVFTARSVTS